MPTPPIEEIRVKFAADQFWIASQLADAELDHAVLPVPGDSDGVRIVSLAAVESWLEGLAIRVKNGGALG